MSGSWEGSPSSGKAGKEVPLPRSGMAGKITHNIGTGENAKNSIVWMTITWSFCIAAGMSIVVVFASLWFGEKEILESLKAVWSIFVPIITLALGYAFGKNK